MPYRIDIASPPSDALDLLIRLGALDIEALGDGLGAMFADGVTPEAVAGALGVESVTVSAAVERDNGSVWLLSPRAGRAGGISITPPEAPATTPNTLRLYDSSAFGTGHHPTTVLCIEALEEMLAVERVDSVLDVGTGTGILALSALTMGVPHALGLDIEPDAVRAAAENARLNNLADRMELIHGGPEAVNGNWPLVVANVLAAPLIEMAPVLVRRLGRRGRLILSGIPCSLEAEVWNAYRHLGMRHIGSKTRGGWTVVSARASW